MALVWNRGRGRWRLLPLLLAAPAAQAALFKYVDPVTRIASYTNFRPPQPGARELVLVPLRPAAPAKRSAAGRAAGNMEKREAAGMVGTMLNVANFPRIDALRQRELDSDRRRIIDDELSAEQAKLAHLLMARAPADQIGRRHANIAALRRELDRLK